MVVGEFVSDADVIVIGAGPGGYVAATRAAQLGKNVLIIDKEEVGGVCLNRGCIPSKTLISAAHQFEQVHLASQIGIQTENIHVDFAKVHEWKRSVIDELTNGVNALLKGNRVERVRGEAFFINEKVVSVVSSDDAKRYRFNHCIIATGSRPVELKPIPFGGRILSSTEALELKELPKSLVVVGGGYIGIELGQMFAKFGTKVTVIEGGHTIIPGFEQEMSRYVSQSLKHLGVNIYTGSTVKEARQTNDSVEVFFLAEGVEKSVDAEYVLVTVGRRPNSDDLGLEAIDMELTGQGHIRVDQQCRTTIENIYAIGDVVEGPALAHKASYEGRIAAEALAGLPSMVDYQAIPAVVFSDPEIASVGLNETEAKKLGFSVSVGKTLFAWNGRALSINKREGFVKLVADKNTRLVIGAQVVGPEASTIIAEIGLAIEMGASLEDISLTVHAHPTLGEMVREAAESALDTH